MVADEVRKLAEKTMDATKEVEGAISLIQQSTTNVVKEMDTAKKRVLNTSDMAREAGGVLDEIVKHSNSIADMVNGIATAAEQQSSTSDEINTRVTQINNLSQEVLSGIRESNRGIQEVSELAGKLAGSGRQVPRLAADTYTRARLRPGLFSCFTGGFSRSIQRPFSCKYGVLQFASPGHLQ